MGQVEIIQIVDEKGRVGLPQLSGVKYNTYKLSYCSKEKALVLSKDKGQKTLISSDCKLCIPDELLAAMELGAGDRVIFYCNEKAHEILFFKL